jgi:hypothetical protein
MTVSNLMQLGAPRPPAPKLCSEVPESAWHEEQPDTHRFPPRYLSSYTIEIEIPIFAIGIFIITTAFINPEADLFSDTVNVSKKRVKSRLNTVFKRFKSWGSAQEVALGGRFVGVFEGIFEGVIAGGRVGGLGTIQLPELLRWPS